MKQVSLLAPRSWLACATLYTNCKSLHHRPDDVQTDDRILPVELLISTKTTIYILSLTTLVKWMEVFNGMYVCAYCAVVHISCSVRAVQKRLPRSTVLSFRVHPHRCRTVRTGVRICALFVI